MESEHPKVPDQWVEQVPGSPALLSPASWEAGVGQLPAWGHLLLPGLPAGLTRCLRWTATTTMMAASPAGTTPSTESQPLSGSSPGSQVGAAWARVGLGLALMASTPS